MLFLVYDVTLQDEYSPHSGVDATDVTYKDKKDLASDESCTGRIIRSLIGEGGIPFSE